MEFYLESEVNSFNYDCFKLSNNLKSTSLAAGLTVLRFVMLGKTKVSSCVTHTRHVILYRCMVKPVTKYFSLIVFASTGL